MSAASPHVETSAFAPEGIYFVRDGSLYRLRIWSEREWTDIPASARPRAEHVPGMGWVGGTFVTALN